MSDFDHNDDGMNAALGKALVVAALLLGIIFSLACGIRECTPPAHACNSYASDAVSTICVEVIR